ncbi:type VI secretion system tip protein TssI/VgrG [Salinicola sp. CPA57]|uniref:type VI secretion system Vgr family protein n=1 Tax=Salinicola sp. CPA57 TaxID=1949080 RepID=UPI000DA15800|nr:type VI secretion system tip protein TssI/VgrG [Salinicola sp. CPA57]
MDPQSVIDEAAGLLDPQHRRLIKLNSSLPDAYGLKVDSFQGEENFSQLYRYDLQLLSENAYIELKQFSAQPLQLEIETSGPEPRYISGYAASVSSRGADEGLARYSVTLRPWMYWLAQRTNSRIFQDVSVEEIIRRVFSEYGPLPVFEFQLRNPLPTRSYCVQYRESDLQFVQRLIERSGLFYFFEQSADGHKLIITDSSIDLPRLEQQPQIRFHRAQVNETEDSVTQWSATRTVQPTRVSLKTFDYKQPGLDSSVSLRSIMEQGDDDAGALDVFDYPGEYRYSGKDQGERLARQHLEMLEAKAKVFQGQGNARALQLGRWFQLEGHYDHERDPAEERQFLVTSIQHYGRNNFGQANSMPASYSNAFTCIRLKIPFRSTYDTPEPVINGPQTATVVGPEGEEIFTDELYRVKVRFHWDRYATGDDKSSCWLRVSSVGAGQGHGFVRIPRIGEEVIVQFLDGDPDRPIVTGTVYNGVNGAPWSGDSSISGIMSRSTKGGTADNASWLMMKDTLGDELVHLHSERVLNITVEADEQHQVDGSEFEDIKKDKTVQLAEGNYTLNVAQGKVTLVAAEEISLQAGASKITMTKGGDIQVDAKSFKVNASSIDLA